jgi:ATP-dependent RNA helicase RhlE
LRLINTIITILKFKEFGFVEALIEGLDAMGFEKATPIQEQAIPLVMQHHDLIACAQTGTGKTAAFLLPVMNKIMQAGSGKLNTLIIVPTRELALQIDQQVEGLAYFTGISSIAVYGGGGGDGFAQQQKAMREGADIIIATPGRLLAMLTQSGSVNMSSVKHLVLDEADRMLDMGFFEDIVRIISYLPAQRQTLLFSATMPPKIRLLANKILNNPKEISIAISKPAEGINQQAYMAYDNQKPELLSHIMSDYVDSRVIIFASTKDKVKDLERVMRKKGMNAEAFHSDLTQAEREELMRGFKSGNTKVLIGTDILSRGIDVDGIGLVLNYDVPPDAEDYIHRIGRTARADTTGTAITFINEKDQGRFADIEALIGKEIPKNDSPENLGKGPVYNPREKRSFGHGHKKHFNRKFKPRPKS